MFDETGKESYICEAITPPLPIKMGLYRCDKMFYTDYVLSLYKNFDKFGLVLIAGEEVTMYSHCGTKIDLIDKFTVHRQKSMKMGGQSAQRFGRIRENQIGEYVKKICERLEKNYVDFTVGSPSVKGLFIGGVGDIKDKVIMSPFLNSLVSSNIRKVITMSEISLDKLMESCGDLTSYSEEEKESLDEIELYTSRDLSRTVYGYDLLLKNIKDGGLEKIYIHSMVEEKFGKENFELAKTMGCKIILLQGKSAKSISFVNSYGGVLGVTWYDIEDNLVDEE
ncbi:MAG: Vms1/Ankzf1 family peptidyl-tRNA hydrolase [Candidatus Colwellbacteria bacterium]|nr:Vms1/Ankzf1 family peptidyl-tRNA hydrolase [Candidatus Colwellbacteria bacterium]